MKKKKNIHMQINNNWSESERALRHFRISCRLKQMPSDEIIVKSLKCLSLINFYSFYVKSFSINCNFLVKIKKFVSLNNFCRDIDCKVRHDFFLLKLNSINDLLLFNCFLLTSFLPTFFDTFRNEKVWSSKKYRSLIEKIEINRWWWWREKTAFHSSIRNV